MNVRERRARFFRIARILLIVLIVAALAFLAAFVPYRAFLPALSIPARRVGELRVHFLSVGQGDCTIVEFPSGAVLMVDAGDGSFSNDNYVIRYLKGLAPASLSIAATHADIDHFGGFSEVLRLYSAEKIYLPPVAGETGAYRRFLAAAERKPCPKATLRRYENLYDASGAYLVCLSPHAAGEDDENSSAAMLYLEYEGVRVLLSSDTPAARERALLEEYTLLPRVFDVGGLTVSLEDIDVLKVGHHGSAGASCEEWLSLLRPQKAVISCGVGNSYGHPAGETLTRLTAVGADIYRTDELGTVVLSIYGGGYTITYGEHT